MLQEVKSFFGVKEILLKPLQLSLFCAGSDDLFFCSNRRRAEILYSNSAALGAKMGQLQGSTVGGGPVPSLTF